MIMLYNILKHNIEIEHDVSTKILNFINNIPYVEVMYNTLKVRELFDGIIFRYEPLRF